MRKLSILLLFCLGCESDSAVSSYSQPDLLTRDEWCECIEIHAADCEATADPLMCFADPAACPSVEMVSFSCATDGPLMVACFDVSIPDGPTLSEVCDH